MRLVCTLPKGHGRYVPHTPSHSPWKWWDPAGTRTARATWVRDWVCRGLLSDGVRRCGTTARNLTEDEVRVKGWRIGRQPDGEPDPLCPACGRPDPATARHLRDLAEIRRSW